MNATAKDLRFHSKELLDTVSRGEEIIITYRGKPCAKIIPYAAPGQNTVTNELFGIRKDDHHSENVDEYVRKLRKGRF
jgi:prevent-host-death family protein